MKGEITMKLSKEFAVGAIVGLAAGVVGTVRLGICGIKKLCEDMKFEREVKSALIKTILGKDCVSYSFKRNNHDWCTNYKEDEDYKVWPKENAEAACKEHASYEMDETAYAVMDIFGVEGLYCSMRNELENDFSKFSDRFINGCESVEDRFIVKGRTYYIYYLRGGKDDDPESICTVEKQPVFVNYCGVFLSSEPLKDLDGKECYELDDDDYGFTGEWMTVSDFLSDEQWRQR